MVLPTENQQKGDRNFLEIWLGLPSATVSLFSFVSEGHIVQYVEVMDASLFFFFFF